MADDDTTTRPSFKHRPIDRERRQIRLFRLLPELEDGLICCQILRSGISTWQYEALSYEWGPPEPTRRILVNGSVMFIRENLWLFMNILRNRRVVSTIQILWADQICIDQQNIVERNHQVQLMGDIYRGANGVLAWLGPDIDFTYEFEKALKARPSPFPQWWFDFEPFRHELDSIMFATYWTRVWIIQELVLARDICFFMGRCKFDRQTLVYLCGCCGPSVSKDFIDRGDMIIQYSYIRGIVDRSATQFSLQDCLENFVSTFTCCTEPRDHIFALAGLIDPADRPPVDYNLSNEEVLGDLICRLWPWEEGDLDSKRYYKRLHSKLSILNRKLGLPFGWSDSPLLGKYQSNTTPEDLR